MSELAERLLEVLSDKPQGAGDIMSLIGVDTKSDLRGLIHELRLNGYPVCSKTHDGGGYWLGNDEDKARTLADLKSRRAKISEIITALENGPINGQMEASI